MEAVAREAVAAKTLEEQEAERPGETLARSQSQARQGEVCPIWMKRVKPSLLTRRPRRRSIPIYVH